MNYDPAFHSLRSLHAGLPTLSRFRDLLSALSGAAEYEYKSFATTSECESKPTANVRASAEHICSDATTSECESNCLNHSKCASVSRAHSPEASDRNEKLRPQESSRSESDEERWGAVFYTLPRRGRDL